MILLSVICKSSLFSIWALVYLSHWKYLLTVSYLAVLYLWRPSSDRNPFFCACIFGLVFEQPLFQSRQPTQLPGLVPKEKAGPLVFKLLRVSRWGQQITLHASSGPVKVCVPRGCKGHRPGKPALILTPTPRGFTTASWRGAECSA